MEKVGNVLDPFSLYKNIGKGDRETVSVKLQNAREWLDKGFYRYLGERYVPQPEYDAVADWLTDNHGKGLVLYGSCGRGKSVLAEQILPKLIRFATGKCVTCYSYRDINSKRNEIMSKALVCLDDVGQEHEDKEYGSRVMAFPDIVDNAEKKGQLLIITTNFDLVDDPVKSLKAKYGERVISRLKEITRAVQFVGNDLRGKDNGKE